MYTTHDRDRAAERRKGINPDYDDTELTALSGHATANLTVEETKFLGGDFEHTHLVKGLDFQLLNRVRQQIDVRAPGEHGVHTDAAGGLRDTGVHDARAPTKHTSPGPANATTMMPPPPPSHGGRHAAPVIDVRTAAPTPAMSFASALGRRVYDTIFRPPRVDVAELYLPRRTAFVYEMDSGNDIPTTLRRSRADCPKVCLCGCRCGCGWVVVFVMCGDVLGCWLALLFFHTSSLLPHIVHLIPPTSPSLLPHIVHLIPPTSSPPLPTHPFPSPTPRWRKP